MIFPIVFDAAQIQFVQSVQIKSIYIIFIAFLEKIVLNVHFLFLLINKILDIVDAENSNDD